MFRITQLSCACPRIAFPASSTPAVRAIFATRTSPIREFVAESLLNDWKANAIITWPAPRTNNGGPRIDFSPRSDPAALFESGAWSHETVLLHGYTAPESCCADINPSLCNTGRLAETPSSVN
jgi:hypothetical protein